MGARRALRQSYAQGIPDENVDQRRNAQVLPGDLDNAETIGVETNNKKDPLPRSGRHNVLPCVLRVRVAH